MNRHQRNRFVKGVIWVGILADALWAVALLVPSVYGLLTGDPGFDPDIKMRLALGVAGSLMACWTLLLVWTLRQPEERRMVLLLTAVAALGMHIVSTIAVVATPTGSLWIPVKTLLIVIGMAVAYHLAGSKDRPDGSGAAGNKRPVAHGTGYDLKGDTRWMTPGDGNRRLLPPFPACSF